MSCRNPMAALLFGCLVTIATAGDAAEVVLQAGDSDGAHAVIAFDTVARPARLTLRTQRAGVAGSRLTISIDRSPVAAFSHLFTAEDCRFPDGRPSVCELVLTADHPAHGVIIESFRLGRKAHVTVHDAGVMTMRQSVSLIGFTRRLDQAPS